jgi:hypothetical protein
MNVINSLHGRKLLLLASLVGGIAFIASTPRVVHAAAPCCSECEPAYDDCVANCGGDPDCEEQCQDFELSCLRFCDLHC